MKQNIKFESRFWVWISDSKGKRPDKPDWNHKWWGSLKALFLSWSPVNHSFVFFLYMNQQEPVTILSGLHSYNKVTLQVTGYITVFHHLTCQRIWWNLYSFYSKEKRRKHHIWISKLVQIWNTCIVCEVNMEEWYTRQNEYIAAGHAV